MCSIIYQDTSFDVPSAYTRSCDRMCIQLHSDLCVDLCVSRQLSSFDSRGFLTRPSRHIRVGIVVIS